MHKRPETVEELQKIGDYEHHCLALIEHLVLYWDGLEKIQPKGYDDFIKDYEDFQGMDEWEAHAKPKQEAIFNGFNDASAGSFNFIAKTSLPHVAYDDLGQARSPLQTLIGACVSYGWACGEVYGKKEGVNSFATEMISLCMKYVK
jgi:hypothetical protein